MWFFARQTPAKGKATELPAGTAGWPFCVFPLLPTRLWLKPRDGAFSSCLQKATSVFLNSSSQHDSVLANTVYELPIHLLLFRGQKDSGYLTYAREAGITQALATRWHSATSPGRATPRKSTGHARFAAKGLGI